MHRQGIVMPRFVQQWQSIVTPGFVRHGHAWYGDAKLLEVMVLLCGAAPRAGTAVFRKVQFR